jgi:ABC-2 type transport system ATP-binding protein
MGVVLEVKNLTKVYSSHKGLSRAKTLRAVDNISFEVHEGEVVGFIGPNGAGKSTTIKMITGLAKPTSGEIKICGYSVDKNHVEAMKYVGGVIETPDMYGDISGENNLKYLVTLHPRETMVDINDPALSLLTKKEIDKKRVEDVLRMVGLWERRTDLVRRYSLGMKQRLGIAQALLSKPKLLVLDEPANGLDPAGIIYIRTLLRKLAEVYKMGILVSSHQLSELQLMCTRVLVISNGKITAEKNMDELAQDETGAHIITLVTDRPQESAEFLQTKFGLHPQIEGSQIKLNTSIDTGTITKELVLAGFNVLGVNIEKVRLEDLFMNATKEAR